MREYNPKQLESLVKGFKKAATIIKMEDPDFVFAPVIGAVPFVDILSIVDRKIKKYPVTYLPNSSRFSNRDELMSRWYSNFYEKNEVGQPMKILCLDEVLTGASAVKGYIQFKKSLEERAKQKAKGDFRAEEKYFKNLKKKIKYKILGMAEKGDYDIQRPFLKLVNSKKVYLIKFDCIPTIDNISLNPVRLKVSEEKHPEGKTIYLPEIEKFDITPKYMTFLRDIAAYVGVDPSTVSPINFSKIEEGLKQAR